MALALVVCLFVGVRVGAASGPGVGSFCYLSAFLTYFFRQGAREPDEPLTVRRFGAALAYTAVFGTTSTLAVLTFLGFVAILGTATAPLIGAAALILLYTRVVTSSSLRALRRSRGWMVIEVLGTPRPSRPGSAHLRRRARGRRRRRSIASTLGPSGAGSTDPAGEQNGALGGDGSDFLAAAVREAVAQMTVEQVCQAWRGSWLIGLDAALDPGRWDLLAATRRCYLDDLDRRDPQGFARWLASGARAGSDPTKFLTGTEQHPGPADTPIEDPPGHQHPAE